LGEGADALAAPDRGGTRRSRRTPRKWNSAPPRSHGRRSLRDRNGVLEPKLKFDRQAILDAVGTVKVTMTIAGRVAGVFYRDVFELEVAGK
jgi:hypothetical protein